MNHSIAENSDKVRFCDLNEDKREFLQAIKECTPEQRKELKLLMLFLKDSATDGMTTEEIEADFQPWKASHERRIEL